MEGPTRRTVLKAACAPALLGGCAGSRKATDIRVEDVAFEYKTYEYRTPIKFGGNVVNRVTNVDVRCRVRTRNGRSAAGFGSMPLNSAWAFPSPYVQTADAFAAMQALAARVAKITAGYPEYGHPIDLNTALEPEYLKAAEEISRGRGLAEPIPKLCTLVTASAFDAAIHDGFGKAHGLNCYHAYGPEFMRYDLARYLTPEFKGEYLDRYVSRRPKTRLPLCHLVGAVDPIFEGDIVHRVDDGLPETVPEWIRYNGLTHLKIKLNGNDLTWDVDRVLKVNRAAEEARPGQRWFYSLDFNEKCPNVDYLLEFLKRARETAPRAFDCIQYVEQPTARDLKAHRENAMHAASALRPIVIDESLTDLESLQLALEMGYTGVALKACKTQSQALLMAAAAQKYKMSLCVQDLTCPGASLIHSAGLAAHIPPVAAIEANARQYVPAGNKGWEDRFPGIFKIRDGSMDASGLTGLGLGAV